MSDLIRFATPRRQSRGELHLAWLDGGTLTIYSGDEPADADEALVAQVALAVLEFDDPAGTVTDGVFTAATIEAALVAESGVASFARAYDSSAGVIADYSVGGVGSGEAVEIDNLNLVAGAYATVVAFTVTEG